MEELAYQSQGECSDGYHGCGCTLEESSSPECSSLTSWFVICNFHCEVWNLHQLSFGLANLPLALILSDDYVTPGLRGFERLLKCLVHNLYCLFLIYTLFTGMSDSSRWRAQISVYIYIAFPEHNINIYTSSEGDRMVHDIWGVILTHNLKLDSNVEKRT